MGGGGFEFATRWDRRAADGQEAAAEVERAGSAARPRIASARATRIGSHHGEERDFVDFR
jgi:hypothetical protein